MNFLKFSWSWLCLIFVSRASLQKKTLMDTCYLLRCFQVSVLPPVQLCRVRGHGFAQAVWGHAASCSVGARLAGPRARRSTEGSAVVSAISRVVLCCPFCPIKYRRTTATRRTHPLHSNPLWPPLAAAHPGLAAHLSWWRRACRHLQAEDTGAWQPGVGAATAADHLQRTSCTQVSSALMAGVPFNALCTWHLAILLFTFKNLSTAGYCHCLTSNVYLNYSFTSSF